MKFHTNIVSKKSMNGETSYSRINIQGIKEIEDLLPTEEQFKEWIRDTLIKINTGQPADMIHIKVKHDVYVDIVKTLYRKLGKNITLYEEDTTYFRIPTRKQNAFYEDISSIFLISEELRVATIVIHV